jgi:hypothetical protein
MKVRKHTWALALAAVLGWHQPADGAGAAAPPGQQSEIDRPAASSRCLARCDEMEIKCNAWEKLYPTCSTVEICDEEKAQCEARCRVTGMADLRSCS